MASNRILSILVISVFLFSCAKEELDSSSSSRDFFNLAVGNQWVYETFNVAEDGQETFLRYDTTLILKDTLINGNFYLMEVSSLLDNSELRIIYQDGESIKTFPTNEVIFSLDESSSNRKYLYGRPQDTIAVIDFQFSGYEEIDVPAGKFQSAGYIGNIQVLSTGIQRRSSHFYAHSIGIVLRQEDFIHSGNRLEQRLFSYSVN